MENKDEKITAAGDELKEKIDNFLDDDLTSYTEESLTSDVSEDNAAETENISTDYNDEEDKVESINNILKNSEIVDKDDYDLENFEAEPNADNKYAGIASESFVQAPVKKKRHIKVPIIISACILAGAILGFLIFSLFFLHSPLGTWSVTTEDNVTYYYTFENVVNENNNNNDLNSNLNTSKKLKMTIGSIDYIGSYTTFESDGKRMIDIQQQYGAFSGQYELNITGSKILGNQEIHLVNGDQEYTLKSAKIPKDLLTVPEDFEEDKNLTGEWVHVFEDYGGLTYKFIFNKDGTMQINQYDTYIYNCTYTCDGSKIKCTFYSLESVTEDIEYSCDGKTLKIMGLECVRAGASTADQK